MLKISLYWRDHPHGGPSLFVGPPPGGGVRRPSWGASKYKVSKLTTRCTHTHIYIYILNGRQPKRVPCIVLVFTSPWHCASGCCNDIGNLPRDAKPLLKELREELRGGRKLGGGGGGGTWLQGLVIARIKYLTQTHNMKKKCMNVKSLQNTSNPTL